MCQKFWSNNKVSISGLTILVKIFGGLHQCAKMLKKSKEIFMIIRGVIHKKTVLLLSGWLGVGGSFPLHPMGVLRGRLVVGSIIYIISTQVIDCDGGKSKTNI